MNIHVAICKGWGAAMVKCCGCGDEFILVRSKKIRFKKCYCPRCKSPSLEQQEDWWRGIIEVDTDDECS